MNPYEAPKEVQEEPDPPRSRLHASSRGALRGVVLGTKWAILLLGPLLALSWVVLITLVIYRYTQDPSGPAPLTNIAMAVITILLAAIGLLLTAVIGAALAGASIMGSAGFIAYRPAEVRKADVASASEPKREEATGSSRRANLGSVALDK